MKPRVSSASWGSFTNGRASLNVSTNQRSAAGNTTLSRLPTFEATDVPDPVQPDVGDVEVHFARLDLNRPWIDFEPETAWPQHCGPLPGVCRGRVYEQ
jgi:hypothetical protein